MRIVRLLGTRVQFCGIPSVFHYHGKPLVLHLIHTVAILELYYFHCSPSCFHRLTAETSTIATSSPLWLDSPYQGTWATSCEDHTFFHSINSITKPFHFLDSSHHNVSILLSYHQAYLLVFSYLYHRCTMSGFYLAPNSNNDLTFYGATIILLTMNSWQLCFICKQTQLRALQYAKTTHRHVFPSY